MIAASERDRWCGTFTGRAARTAAEIVAALAKIFAAEALVPVRSVQVAGVSYHNLGAAGLAFLEQMADDGRACVATTLNPAGMDLMRPEAMGLAPDFIAQQRRVIRAFERMGIETSCTCTPYLLGNAPAQGDTLAWSESSAVTYANSVLGAHSNREGGPSALASALCGHTAQYGLHLESARRPTLHVEVDGRVKGSHEFGLLGATIGRLAPDALPLITGLEQATVEELKALSAALPTYGGQPMFHIAGITPEASQHKPPAARLQLSLAEMAAHAGEIADQGTDIDLVALGCPHASVTELRAIADQIGQRNIMIPMWISTARAIRDEADALGIVERLEAAGALIMADTCFAVAPLRGRFHAVATDSAKGCYYGRGHNRFSVRLGSMARCVEAAVAGRWR